MNNVRFTYVSEKDSDQGVAGWILNSAPMFDPSVEMGIAHDVIEHGYGDAGTLEEEIQAIGSLIFTRLESGWIAGMGLSKKDTEIVVDNIINTISDYSRDNMNILLQSGVKSDKTTKSLDSLSDYGERVINEAIKKLKSELLSKDQSNYAWDDSAKKSELISVLSSPLVLSNIRNNLRKGYRRAYHRFNGDSCAGIDSMIFCKKAVKTAESNFSEIYGELTTGCELSISVKGKLSEVFARIKAPYYYPICRVSVKVAYGLTQLLSFTPLAEDY